MPPESEIFRMSQRALLVTLFRRHGILPAACGAIAALALCAVAFALHDVRYAILALMTVLILIPMLMALLYFNHALHPDVAFNTLPHRLSLGVDGVEITILPKAVEKAGKKKYSKNEDSGDAQFAYATSLEEFDSGHEQSGVCEMKTENHAEETAPAVTKVIGFNRLGRYTVGIDSVLVPVTGAEGHADGFIYIPRAAFGSIDLFKGFIDGIASRIRKNYE